MKNCPTIVFLFLLSTTAAAAQVVRQDTVKTSRYDINRVKVGDQAPNFSLEDLSETKISLSDFRGKKNVVLVFYRGYW